MTSVVVGIIMIQAQLVVICLLLSVISKKLGKD